LAGLVLVPFLLIFGNRFYFGRSCLPGLKFQGMNNLRVLTDLRAGTGASYRVARKARCTKVFKASVAILAQEANEGGAR